MRITFLILVLSTITLLSCKSSEPQSKGTSISFTEIKSGNNSGSLVYKTLIINNREELIAAWSIFFVKYDRKPPIPNIDFENKTLIAAFLGERNSGGYSIKIKSILETKKLITIITEENRPGKTCLSSAVMIYPFQLIEMPKTEKEILFSKTVKTNECGKGF